MLVKMKRNLKRGHKKNGSGLRNELGSTGATIAKNANILVEYNEILLEI